MESRKDRMENLIISTWVWEKSYILLLTEYVVIINRMRYCQINYWQDPYYK